MAGFFAESILSCGGQIVLPDGYLKAIYACIRQQGGLCIADEVQVGFGRVGKAWWAFEEQEVIPDIVTLGKPIGNGHPMGALVTTRAIAEQFANGMEFFSTFGGNPVSCAIGSAVLGVVQDEGLMAKVEITGTYLLNGLRKLQNNYPNRIGDVRGRGLFLGIEFVKDQDSRLPDPKTAFRIVQRLRERGILLSTDGPFDNVIKMKPPMVFGRVHADFFLKELAFILGNI